MERAGAPKVLIADDNETNRRILQLILETTGVDLTLTADGAQAVEAASVRAFDLVIMDIQMPVMDGLEAMRRIRRLEAERGAPRTAILALSANAMAADVEASLAAGADKHVAKPVEAGALLAMLGELLQAQAEAPAAKKASGAA